MYFVFKSQLQFPQVAYLMWPATLLRQWAWHGTVACPFESTSKSYAHCGWRQFWNSNSNSTTARGALLRRVCGGVRGVGKGGGNRRWRGSSSCRKICLCVCVCVLKFSRGFQCQLTPLPPLPCLHAYTLLILLCLPCGCIRNSSQWRFEGAATGAATQLISKSIAKAAPREAVTHPTSLYPIPSAPAGNTNLYAMLIRLSTWALILTSTTTTTATMTLSKHFQHIQSSQRYLKSLKCAIYRDPIPRETAAAHGPTSLSLSGNFGLHIFWLNFLFCFFFVGFLFRKTL